MLQYVLMWPMSDFPYQFSNLTREFPLQRLDLFCFISNCLWNYSVKCCTFQIKSSRTTFQIRSSRTKYHKILKPTHSKFLPKHWRMSTDTTRFWYFFQPMTSKLSYLEVQNFVVPEFSWKSMLQKELRHSQLTLYNIRWKSGKYACKTFKM